MSGVLMNGRVDEIGISAEASNVKTADHVYVSRFT